MAVLIEHGQVLIDGEFRSDPILARRGGLSLAPACDEGMRLDARDLLVLPGIVDIHGDAFERQIEPRPGVCFPLALALVETDRQLIANGITTACHAVTCSWEPGLRSFENAAALLDMLNSRHDDLCADTRFHFRHEIFNLDAEARILAWLRAGRFSVLAFNDHMEGIVRTTGRKSAKLGRMIERTGLPPDEYMKLVERVWSRRDEVPESVERLAAAAREAGIAILSHDDRHVEDRRRYRALGSRIAEFPMTQDTARDAIAAGDEVVFGAPNVVRGGSHTGCPAASEMVTKGLCTILASDYFYPAMRQAAHRLAAEDILPLASAWPLISTNPARALGLADRGAIAEGLRADLVLARRTEAGIVIVATIVDGRLVFLSEPDRIRSTAGEAPLASRAA